MLAIGAISRYAALLFVTKPACVIIQDVTVTTIHYLKFTLKTARVLLGKGLNWVVETVSKGAFEYRRHAFYGCTKSLGDDDLQHAS